MGVESLKAADVAFSVAMSGLSPVHSPEVREYHENAKLSLSIQREALAALQELLTLVREEDTKSPDEDIAK
jgi:hypothetical protein